MTLSYPLDEIMCKSQWAIRNPNKCKQKRNPFFPHRFSAASILDIETHFFTFNEYVWPAFITMCRIFLHKAATRIAYSLDLDCLFHSIYQLALFSPRFLSSFRIISRLVRLFPIDSITFSAWLFSFHVFSLYYQGHIHKQCEMRCKENTKLDSSYRWEPASNATTDTILTF